MNLARRAGLLAAVMLLAACAGSKPAAGAPDAALLVGTSWLAEDIAGGGVLDRLQTTVSFVGDGNAAGSGGCNRYAGPVEIKAETIRFGALASTMMACKLAAMQQEQRFFAALADAARWKLTSENKLVLSNAAGAPVAVFTRLPQGAAGG